MNAAIIVMNGLIAGATASYVIEMMRSGFGVTAAFALIVGSSLVITGEKLRRMEDEPER